MLIFVLQAVLIGLIIAAQFQKGETSNVRLVFDVPYDISASTRIGQVAGIAIIIFYQKDYWIASTLLEIRFLGGPSEKCVNYVSKHHSPITGYGCDVCFYSDDFTEQRHHRVGKGLQECYRKVGAKRLSILAYGNGVCDSTLNLTVTVRSQILSNWT